MSISLVTRDTEHQQDRVRVAPAEIYEQLINSNSDICPRCFQWRGQQIALDAARDEIAVTVDTENDGLQEHPASVEPDAAVLETPVYPTISNLTTPAHVPEARACECGDLDRAPPPVRSKQEALSLVDVLAQRLGEFGFVYSLPMLRAVVRQSKECPDTASDDDRIFSWAVAAAVLKARGEDPKRVLCDGGGR